MMNSILNTMNKFKEFTEELNKLEEKYGMKIEAYSEEDWDEGIDGEWYSIGTETYLSVCDEENEIDENLIRDSDGKLITEDQ